jgi:transposase
VSSVLKPVAERTNGLASFAKHGHTVRLMAAQFVNLYRKSGKNDVNDAEAICEAVGRPNMRFVPVKSDEQRAVLMMHRTRNLTVSNRTAQGNQIRGLLGEFGLVVPVGMKRLQGYAPSCRTKPATSPRNVTTLVVTPILS